MTVCVCDFNNFGFWVKDSKKFCEMSDIYAKVSKGVIVVLGLNVIGYTQSLHEGLTNYYVTICSKSIQCGWHEIRVHIYS